jgi:GTPase
VRVIPVENRFFGGNTGVTGLMTGEDLTRVLADEPAGHRYLLPDVCLSDDGRFLDGSSVDDLPTPVEVVTTDGIALRKASGAGTMTTMTTDMDHPHELPTVVIVGRPNVGKSTLFNRVIGEQAAIVENRPGVTRDRKELEAEWLGVPFRVIDTGGWMPRGSDLDDKVSRQVEAAVAEADLVLLVVDASVGVLEDDEAVADWLRRGDHQVLVVANKADNNQREDDLWQFLSLGLGDAFPVSALHGRRAGDLLDVVLERLGDKAVYVPPRATTNSARRSWSADDQRRPGGDRRATERRQEHPVQPARGFGPLGRPRHGRHDPRRDRHPRRDRGRPDRLRRHRRHAPRAKIDDAAEYYSLVRALRAIDDADVALLVIDATEGVTGQDQRLAERVDASGCPIVILLNKWELVDDAERRLEIETDVRRKLAFVGDVPVLKISALTGKGVHKLRPGSRRPSSSTTGGCPPGRQQGDRRGAAAVTRRRGSEGALRRAGRDRPADVHAVREPRAAAAPRALPRATDPGGVRVRLDADQAPDPQEDD